MNSVELDRRDVLPGLLKRLDGFRSGYRQNVALLGEAGLGKTTLLKRLVQGPFNGRPDLLFVCVEMGESENLVEWASRFIQTLLYAVLQSRGCEVLPTRWPELMEQGSSYVPRVTSASRKILDLAEAGRSDLAYQQIWELLHWVSQDLECRVVLLLDEFQRLRSLPVKEPFGVLGRKIMVQSSVLYLMTSSEPVLARDILREGLALLFGHFEILEIRPLGSAVCRKAVRLAWPECRKDPFFESWVAELGEGRPDLLVLLLEGLRKHQDLSPGASPEQVLLDLLERFFLDPESVLRRRFEEKLRSLPDHWSRLYCTQLLAVVAGGVSRAALMAEATGRSLERVRRFLRVLEQSRLVLKEGTLYHVPERLFQLWLVTAYPVLQGVWLADSVRARAHFRESIAARIERCRAEFLQPLEERLAGWMQKWNGDQVEIDGRRTQLPGWRSVRHHRLSSGPSVLRGQGKAGGRTQEWQIVLAEPMLSEAGARRVVEELSHSSSVRNGRKFLVSIGPMDINARLVLQQGKIKVWDLPLVNHLLDLYGVARVWVPDEWDPPVGLEESLYLPAVAAEETTAGDSPQGAVVG